VAALATATNRKESNGKPPRPREEKIETEPRAFPRNPMTQSTKSPAITNTTKQPFWIKLSHSPLAPSDLAVQRLLTSRCRPPSPWTKSAPVRRTCSPATEQ
jgi:hypothetical protein